MRARRKGWAGLAGLLATLVTAACMRIEQHAVRLEVPDMAGARDIRIVTNAALNEIIGRYDGIKNDVEVDIARGLVLYHEGHRLQNEAYRRHIEECLREVGFEATFQAVRLNPPPPVPTTRGFVQMWPDRYTAVLSVPALKSCRDANVVVDAIALARTGDHPSIAPHAPSHTLRVAYSGRALALKNVEHAIANAGYAVNGIPADLGRSDAVPGGWSIVTLQ